jgi:hypothetical protein
MHESPWYKLPNGGVHVPRIYKQGEVFYELHDCLHLLATNPRPGQRAVFVAVIIISLAASAGSPCVVMCSVSASRALLFLRTDDGCSYPKHNIDTSCNIALHVPDVPVSAQNIPYH